jgi:hypothetical protein
MGQTYRLVGSQDPSSRIDRVVVEEPSGDNPEGKVLELNGDPVELSDDQVMKIAGVARLERSDLEEGESVAEFGPENYPDEQDDSPQEGEDAPSEPQPQQPQAAEGQSQADVVESVTAPATPAESTKVSGARSRREA